MNYWMTTVPQGPAQSDSIYRMTQDHPVPLRLDTVVAALDAAIDAGAWMKDAGICGHCYGVGNIYVPNPDIIVTFVDDPDPSDICKDCLIYRALWNAYLDAHP